MVSVLNFVVCCRVVGGLRNGRHTVRATDDEAMRRAREERETPGQHFRKTHIVLRYYFDISSHLFVCLFFCD